MPRIFCEWPVSWYLFLIIHQMSRQFNLLGSTNIKKIIVKNVVENYINQKWGGWKKEFFTKVVHVYEIFS